MLILSIDTSCDETSVAITDGSTVLANVVASQIELHKKYGGVFPTVAKQAHRENIGPCIKAALKMVNGKWQMDDIDAIAVTVGPGLAPALEIGINQAKELVKTHHKKLIGVNHIEGHLLSVLAEPNCRGRKFSAPTIPVLSVVVSGGHSEFILLKQIGDYQKLGQTIDDAAGECLDKVGRLLGLGYPAGAVIEKFAKQGDAYKYKFPLPMTESGDFNLSFSGLKTHSKNLIKKLEAEGKLDKQCIYDLAAGIQQAVIRHISHKLEKLLLVHPEIREIWLGGGVAANIALRQALRKIARKNKLKFRVPYSKKLCGDNAAMIGVVAHYKYERGELVQDLSELDRRPNGKIDDPC